MNYRRRIRYDFSSSTHTSDLGTTIGLVQNLVAELTRADSPGQTPGPLSDLANLIRSIDCFRRICVFRKK